MNFITNLNTNRYDFLYEADKQEHANLNNKTLNIIFINICLILIQKCMLKKLKK